MDLANAAGDECDMPAVTLYRLKGGHTDLADYVDERIVGKPKATGTITRGKVALWRKTSSPAVPPWAKVVRGAFPNERFVTPSPRDNALVLISIDEGGKVAYWAMAFGPAAWRWIEASLVDREAPLIAIFEHQRDSVTGVVSNITATVALDISRQAQRVTKEMREGQTYAAFEMDGETQPLRAARAKPKGAALGRTLRAGDGVHLTSIDDFDKAVDAVRVLERAVRSGRARGKTVPGISEITDTTVIARLDGMLVDAVKAGRNVSLVLPDRALERPLALEASGTSPGIESFDIADLRAELRRAGMLTTLTTYTLDELVLVDPDEIASNSVEVWPYLEAALPDRGKLYFLADQLWYEAPANWLAAVNQRVDRCPSIDTFPDYAHTSENDYNEKALTPHLSPAVCLDRKLTRAPGFGQSGIEILDVLAMGMRSNDGVPILRFVAVKRGLLSGELSHLFTQVGTAADSLADPVVREAFLDVVHKSSPPTQLLALADDLLGPMCLYDPTRIEMVIAIVGQWGAKSVSQAVPVLGRAGLQRTLARLASLNHLVSVARVKIGDLLRARSGAHSPRKMVRRRKSLRRIPPAARSHSRGTPALGGTVGTRLREGTKNKWGRGAMAKIHFSERLKYHTLHRRRVPRDLIRRNRASFRETLG